MKILVAVDGSEYSRDALVKAAELASGLPAQLLILTVSNYVNFGTMGPLGYGPDAAIEVPSKEEAANILQAASDFLAARGLQTTTFHRLGNFAETILAMAEEAHVDLVVMGSHGRTGLQRFLLGSVSSQVMSHAPCSVLIAKGPHPVNEETIPIPATHIEKI